MAAPSTDVNGQVKVETEEQKEPEEAPPTATDDVDTGNAEEEEPEEELEEGAEAPESSVAATATVPAKEEGEIKKWPGWPGDNVFRLVVPVVKVGGLIGKKGEFIKKLCEETRAKIRVLEGVPGTTDRVILIYAKEEPEAELSPAMDAVIRVFKRISGVFENGADSSTQASSTPVTCSARLLVPASQAINLIGKQGSSIKSIQENTGATIRIITGEELPYYAAKEERFVDMAGESSKVLKALEAVVGHLRKFLVDHSIVHLFEKNPNASAAQAQPQDRVPDAWSDKAPSFLQTFQQPGMGNDYTLPSLKRDSLFLEHDSLDSQIQRPLSSLYRQEPLSGLRQEPLSGLHPAGLGRTAGALVTQVTQTMKIPLTYAEDIIGIGGGNIAYIRSTSGAVLTVQETGGLRDEITVEIKGTSTQVSTAQQLIQEFMSGHKEPPTSSYGGLDTGLRSSYSHLGSSAYPSSSLTSQYGGYGSGLGGYGSYRF